MLFAAPVERLNRSCGYRLLRIAGLAIAAGHGIRLQVLAALVCRLMHLNGGAMHIGIGVMANAGHLPGDLRVGLTAGDLKAVA